MNNRLKLSQAVNRIPRESELWGEIKFKINVQGQDEDSYRYEPVDAFVEVSLDADEGLMDNRIKWACRHVLIEAKYYIQISDDAVKQTAGNGRKFAFTLNKQKYVEAGGIECWMNE